MKKKTLLSGVGLLVALVLFLAVNVLSSAALRSARVDMTEGQLYTLSQGTRNILSSLEEPITLRMYFSRKLAGDYPSIEGYASRVEDLLVEYARRSGGALSVEVLDPEPFSEIEERAIQYGLKGVPAGPAGEVLYFGLVGVNSTDDEELIAFFQPEKERFLEYDITRLVHALSNPKRGKVGLMSTLPLEGAMPDFARGEMPEPWVIMDQLRQMFEVKTIPTSATEIPSDVEVLMVVHPKGFSDGTLFAIDQFVLRGGKALVFVDPFCEEDVPARDPTNPMAAMTAERSSNLGPLLEAWGVKLAPGVFAADRVNARVVTDQSQGRPQAVPYLAWLRLPSESMNREDVVTSELGALNLASAGVLEPVDAASTQVTPLLETSTESMRVQTNRIQFAPNPAALLGEFFPIQKKLMLAARITGNAKSAFPGGRPAEVKDAESEESDDGAPADEEAVDAAVDLEGLDKGATETDSESNGDSAVLSESQTPINVVVFGDADVLADKWWAQVQDFLGTRLLFPTADNANLVINALDNLSGSSDLISLRGRGGYERRFEVVQNLERQADERFRAKKQALEDRLQEAERRISELQTQKEGVSALILSPEQRAELEKFRDEQIRTKRELREVNYGLRKDINRLGIWLKFINIWLIPLLLSAAVLGMWFHRTFQRHKS